MSIIPPHGLQAVLAGICSVSFLYFGFYILSLAIKEKRIRPLFYLCIFSSLWCFSYMMYYHSSDANIKDIWQRFTYSGANLVFTYLLWFFIKYTSPIKNKKIELFISFAIWILPLISVYKSISHNAVAHDFPFGFWYLFMAIQTTIYILIGVSLLLLFYFRKKSYKSRMQSVILCGSGVVLVIISWSADYYMGFMGSQSMPPFLLLLWLGILLFTIKKYRFIRITPEFIGKDITENIEEGIILLDPELKIIFANNALRRLLNIDDNEPISLYNIVYEKQILDNELSKLTNKNGISFRIQINFILCDNNTKVPVDIKVKKIIDAYNDTSGYLMIVSKVRDMGYLKMYYGISGRELEVIRQLAVGRSNKDIARFLSIKETTIETHIKSIYNKIGIKNRFELLNLLFEFALSSHPKPYA